MSQTRRTRVVVHGALGRMGQEVLRALADAPDLEPVGAADARASAPALRLPAGGEVPLASSLDALLDRVPADVVVDFSSAEGARRVLEAALPRRVRAVIGSTGLTEEDHARARELAEAHAVGVVIAPNFSLGAVLLIWLARKVSRFFEYAEVLEAHHEAKVDAPSGTALALARAILEGREGPLRHTVPETEPLPGTRGGEVQGVHIHAVRMPGRLAHHEVLFGAPGQVLALRHDSISRESFMPGVLLAVRRVMDTQGLLLGLEALLGLE